MSILVTGMSGLIGGLVRARLGADAELAALNRQAVEGIPTTRADLADYDAIRPAFDGQNVVVHLAAKAGERFTWDELLQTNVAGTRNVLQAAADAGAADKPSRPRDYAVWCSQRDIAQAIACSVSAPVELKCDVFFANSRNRWGYRDLTHAEEAVGFVPEDSAEDHRQ